MKALGSSRLGAGKSAGRSKSVNRRTFLQTVGAGLVMTKTQSGQASAVQIEHLPDVVVVGAGTFGIWTDSLGDPPDHSESARIPWRPSWARISQSTQNGEI